MYDTFAGFESLAEFQALDEHSFVDIVQYGDEDRKPTFLTNELKHAEVSQWLNEKVLILRYGKGSSVLVIDEQLPDGVNLNNNEGATAKIRVLLCSPRRKSFGSGIFFPFSRDLYAEIASCFRLPPAVIGYASAENIILTPFEAFEGGYGMLAVLKRRTLVVTYDPATATTYVLEIGFCTHDIDSFIDELKHFQKAKPLVTAMVASWTTVNTQLRARSFVDKKLAILNIEDEIGLHLGSDIVIRKDLRNIKFEGLTRKLMILKNAWDDTATEFHLKLLSRILGKRRFFLNGAIQLDRRTSPLLHLRVVQLRDLLTGLRAGNKEILHRADVVLQTIYNLISQRDNEINSTTAVASQRIAEASHRDSLAMKQLAADSRDIALRTYRDSAHVKAMTWINLCTLPGTFTATFFSTGFFNLQPKDSSTVVSRWIWLYCVITLGLTCLLFLSWYIGSRQISRPLEISESSLSLPNAIKDNAALEEENTVGSIPQKGTTSEEAIGSRMSKEPALAHITDPSPFLAKVLAPEDAGAVREKLRTWFPTRALVLENTCSICAKPLIGEQTNVDQGERGE